MRTVRQEIGGLGNLMFKQAYIWAQMRESHIPDVYVQGEKYWVKYKEEIKQMYSHGIGSIPKVALHIRRGDYLKASQFHVNLWMTDYYEEAVKHFPKDTEYLVFCKDNQSKEQDLEDRDWCKVNLPRLIGDHFEMAPANTSETEDLNLMASCSSIIMANSSFSWWAAYLGTHEKVICPKQWFTDGQERVELLPEWKLI